jgi:hypothetical protein
VEKNHPPRRQVHGYVSTEARDGWYDFAEQQGTNVTALLEATGLLLGEHVKRGTRQLPAWLRKLVAQARRVASSRSSRQRRET